MKVAIVGCGNIAATHIHGISKSHHAHLAALCDQNQLRAQQLGEQHNLPYYTDPETMLSQIRPAVVHILTPPHTHATLVLQALEAKCHVLVEKPLCMTVEEVDAIYRAAESVDRLVSVDHTHLWSPFIQRAIQAISSGRWGRIIHMHYVMGDDYLEAVKGGYARWALGLPGGAFFDLISHPLYLIRAFLPHAEVISARACGADINNLHELWVDFIAEGAAANLWMSLNQRPLEHYLRISCRRGTIRVDLRNFSAALISDRELPGPAARLVNTLSECWQRGAGVLGNMMRLPLGRFDPKAGMLGAISAFYQAVERNQPPPVSPPDAKAVVELSAKIWDLLEHRPGAIRSAADESGQNRPRKVSAGFIKCADHRPARVLVTGGTGFIGGHLVRRLVSAGRKVRVFARPFSRLDGLPAEGVELAWGDVGDLGSVRSAMEDVEVLYHLAAATGGDWATFRRGTVVGTQNVLQAAQAAGVRKVIYMSSLGVLHASHFPNGRDVDGTFPLEKRPEARGHYSRAKLEAERVACQYADERKLPLWIVRPGLVYGPGQEEFLSDAGFRLSKRFLLVIGIGRRRLGLTYVENLVDALLLVEQNGRSAGRIYHVVDSSQPTVRQYIETYRRTTGERLSAVYIPVFLWLLGFGCLDFGLRLKGRAAAHFVYRLRSLAKSPRFDITRTEKELNWKARVPFEEAMYCTYGSWPRRPATL